MDNRQRWQGRCNGKPFVVQSAIGTVCGNGSRDPKDSAAKPRDAPHVVPDECQPASFKQQGHAVCVFSAVMQKAEFGA